MLITFYWGEGCFGDPHQYNIRYGIVLYLAIGSERMVDEDGQLDGVREATLRVVVYEIASIIGAENIGTDPVAVRVAQMLSVVEARNISRERENLV